MLPKELPPMIRINRAVCPLHGNILPEAFSIPFSLNTELLEYMPLVCGVCIYEGGIETALINAPDIEWETVSKPLTQHWSDIGYNEDALPQYYPIWEVRPVEHSVDEDGNSHAIYRTGSKRHINDSD